MNGCQKEKGFCVTSKGEIQNGGKILHRNNITTVEEQMECLKLCQAYKEATACQATLTNSEPSCQVHTKEVMGGDNNESAVCWVFSKCQGKYFVFRCTGCLLS